MEFDIIDTNELTSNWLKRRNCQKLYCEIEFLENVAGQLFCSVCQKHLGNDTEDRDDKYEHMRKYHHDMVKVRYLFFIYKHADGRGGFFAQRSHFRRRHTYKLIKYIRSY